MDAVNRNLHPSCLLMTRPIIKCHFWTLTCSLLWLSTKGQKVILTFCKNLIPQMRCYLLRLIFVCVGGLAAVEVTSPQSFHEIVTCWCWHSLWGGKKNLAQHRLSVSQSADGWLSACFPSYREVCPPNCLKGTVACWKAVNPILKAMGCHLTSAITRFNHKLLNHLKNIRIFFFFLLQKQTKPVKRLIATLMIAYLAFLFFDYLLFWAEQFLPKINVWRELQSEIICIFTQIEISFHRCRI